MLSALGASAARGRGDRCAAVDAVCDRAVAGFDPHIGKHIGPLLAFANAYAFTGVPWFGGFPPSSWGPLGSLLYVAGVVATVFLAALFVINRRSVITGG